MSRPHSPYHARRAATPDLGDPIRADRQYDGNAWPQDRCGVEHDGIPRVAAAGPAVVITCTLRPQHDGRHEDHVSDAPAIIAWAS